MTREEIFRAEQTAMSDKELIELVRNQVSKLCETRGKSLTMSVPPMVADTDMLICELADRYEKLIGNKGRVVIVGGVDELGAKIDEMAHTKSQKSAIPIVTQWVAVTDRLPEKSERVLLGNDMKEKIDELMDRFDEGNMCIDDLHSELLDLYNVTYCGDLAN